MSVESSLDYLASADCFDSLRRDPYWPKWDSPWWHMTLLWELGKASLIPKAACDAMMESIDRKWRRGWLPSELPGDVNRKTDIPCFCGAGTIEQVLRAAGADVDAGVPWLRGWGLKYVLKDGGVNCDEDSLKSSFQSTVVLAEAVLSRPELTEEEVRFLDGAANYLIVRKLFRTSGGDVVDIGWLTPKFPRFYDYDVARGLRYLSGWAKRLGRTVPPEATVEAEKALAKGGGATEPADCLRDGERWFPLLTDCSRSRGPGGQTAGRR